VAPHYEVKLQRKDGSWFYGEINAKPIAFPSNQESGIQVWVKDIDDRKHSEEALKESEVRYRNLVENSSNAIILYRQQEILFANEPFFNIFRYEHKELQGMAIDNILAPEVVGMVAELRQRRIAGEIQKAAVYESKGRRKDGEIFDMEISVCVMSHQGEQCCMAFLSDISGRKQAEEALRESEEKYRTILENIEDGYYEVDLQGNIDFFNNSLCRIYGYSADELIGLSNTKYMDKKNVDYLHDVLAETFRSRKPLKNLEWEIITKDGIKKCIEGSVSLIIDAEGHRRGFRGILRDVTKKR